jgi:aminoglycoside phosphotransferase (APT) family kinase protein
MTVIADTIAELTPQWFTDALRESGTIDAQTAVTAADCVPVGVGQTAALVRAHLAYEGAAGGPPSVIVKQPSTDEGRRGLATAMGFYRSEVRFYEEVSPRVEIAAPRVYSSALEESTGRFTLVIEDLSGNAESGDMLAGATAEQATLAISALVGLQAPLWDNPWNYQRDWLCDHTATRMFFEAAGQALQPFLDRFGDSLETDQIELVKRLAPRAGSAFDEIWRPPFVVSHGDYRLDNMMFGTAPDAPRISVVDWQTARNAPPGIDLAVFLATCVDVETRRATERDHLCAWVDGLNAAGVESFTFDDAWQSYRSASLYPLLICIAAAATLSQTERDDRLWRQISQGAAALVTDTQAEGILA